MKAIIGAAMLAGLAGWAGLEEARSRASVKPDDGFRWRDDGHEIFRAATYCPNQQTLTLEFRQGYAYRYHGVPPDCFAAFKAARAKGAFFNERVRGRFDVERALDRILTRTDGVTAPPAPPNES